VLRHEEKAREVHPRAKDFRLEFAGFPKKPVGWSFFIPEDGEDVCSVNSYSWVNLDEEVPDDIYTFRQEAAETLKAHQKLKHNFSMN